MEKKKPMALLLIAAAIFLLVGYVVPHRSPGAGAALTLAEPTIPAQLSTGVAPGPDASPQAQPTSVAVYVCGDVHRPGVYSMTSAGRVADAVAKAGGALADADLEQLNLAAPLSDAMKIDVPKKGARIAPEFAGLPESAQDTDHVRPSRHRSGHSSHKLQPGQTLDVNTASESELTQLPGVGPSLARRIVEYRTGNGPFQSVDDLQNVSGIGPSKFEKMAPYVRL